MYQRSQSFFGGDLYKICKTICKRAVTEREKVRMEVCVYAIEKNRSIQEDLNFWCMSPITPITYDYDHYGEMRSAKKHVRKQHPPSSIHTNHYHISRAYSISHRQWFAYNRIYNYFAYNFHTFRVSWMNAISFNFVEIHKLHGIASISGSAN